jgi:hypothetical protein
VPLLKQLFSQNTSQIDQIDIVLLMTPHIVRTHEITEADLKPIYIGSQQNLGVGGPPPLIAVPEAAPPPAAAPAPAPGVPGGATVIQRGPGSVVVVPPGSTPVPGTLAVPSGTPIPGTVAVPNPTAPTQYPIAPQPVAVPPLAAPAAPATPTPAVPPEPNPAAAPTTQPTAAPGTPPAPATSPAAAPGTPPAPATAPAATPPATTPPAGTPPSAGAATTTPPAGTPPAAGAAGTTPPAGTPPAAGAATTPPAVSTQSTGIGSAQVLISTPGTTFRVGGGPYTVPLLVSDAARLSTVTLTLVFDATKLRVRSVQEGSFLRSGGVAVTFSQQVNGNRIDISLSRGGDTTGASGTGVLAAVLFDAVVPGAVTLTLSGTATGPGGTAMGLRFTPVTVTVQ